MHDDAVIDAGVIQSAPSSCHSRRSSAGKMSFCYLVGKLAVRSLYREMVLYPKPGLVSRVDNGSHDDMTAVSFMRSLFALRHFFIEITAAGFDHQPFPVLQHLGIAAEQRMLEATGGINTHRGAIFCLGLLCAAAGYCKSRRIALSPQAIRAALLKQWGQALQQHMRAPNAGSHGARVALRYAVGGARQEAALGFPALFGLALPAFRRTLQAGRGPYCAAIEACFALMAFLDDTNIYHRGGETGAALVRQKAQHFLAAGGTAQADWKEQALACHRLFMHHRLSPGGAADLLAATYLMHELGFLAGLD